MAGKRNRLDREEAKSLRELLKLRWRWIKTYDLSALDLLRVVQKELSLPRLTVHNIAGAMKKIENKTTKQPVPQAPLSSALARIKRLEEEVRSLKALAQGQSDGSL